MRFALDGFVILTLLFYGGVGWNRITALEQGLARIERADASRMGSVERLARIEEKVDRLTRDMDRLTSTHMNAAP